MNTSAAAAFLHPDRLLPADPKTLSIARDLLASVADEPIFSPHGHVPIEWFRPDFRFSDATDLLIRPDHYLLRMLVSQGHRYEDFGVASRDGSPVADSRQAFRNFAACYRLFLGTPSRLWLDHALYDVLGVTRRLEPENADWIFDFIGERLAEDAFTARALYGRFNIELLATTDAATDSLADHKALADDESWNGSVIPTFRPDVVTDPDSPDFGAEMAKLADQTGEDVVHWSGYLAALRNRRAFFKQHGAVATDHGVTTPDTADLPEETCQRLLTSALGGNCTPEEAASFRARMLFEMARMSVEDGLVMQIHAGSWRNYAPSVFERFGPNMGFDMPMRTSWAKGLKPMLDAFGFERNLSVVLFTLDESTHSRELAPLAGAFPTLRLGAPWWFFDSPLGMDRHFDLVVETAGFFNLSGFVDDTRALLSIPARHDVYRRCVASKLATMVAGHLLSADDAAELAQALAIGFARETYRVGAG